MTVKTPETFALSPHDKQNPLWLKLRAHLEKELAVRRLKNDDEKLGESQTAALRGEIRTLKNILRLGEDRPIVETPKNSL